jgi:predicted unusual protein kinase regulating ubiquinone biosynthesis (AarF/ABC1/UbiB family)
MPCAWPLKAAQIPCDSSVSERPPGGKTYIVRSKNPLTQSLANEQEVGLRSIVSEQPNTDTTHDDSARPIRTDEAQHVLAAPELLPINEADTALPHALKPVEETLPAPDKTAPKPVKATAPRSTNGAHRTQDHDAQSIDVASKPVNLPPGDYGDYIETKAKEPTREKRAVKKSLRKVPENTTVSIQKKAADQGPSAKKAIDSGAAVAKRRTGDLAQPPRKQSDIAAAAGTQIYNPLLADRAVRARNILTDKRFLKMAKTLMRFSLEFCADQVLKPKAEEAQEHRKRNARRLRQALVDLGPTFIKLGQFLSVRRDCLSIEMADELALLQDKVPPFSYELVKKTITSELGAPPDQIFQSFDEKPIASASIGQVHKAVLPDGRPVVVKVQRPDLARRFYQDLGCMRLLARWGVLLKPEGQWQSWIELSDEFGKNLFQEINYLQEGRNADRVRSMLKEQPEVQIPRVDWKHTGRRVLTLEYLPGIKIDRVKELEQRGYNLAKIGTQLVNCYLEMVLMHGFFHADPHAGNLCIAPDGRIIIYDFGMMGEITDEQKEAITGCIASVIKRDTQELVQHLIELGIVDKDAQIGPIMRTVQPFIDYYAGKPLLDLDFTDLEHDIDSIANDRALQLPPTLAYLLRAGSSLEGIARTLRPNFSFVEAAKAPLKKWVMSRPYYAASLVKVFINGNLNIGQEAFLKLANGKPSEAATKLASKPAPKPAKDDKPSKVSAKPPGAAVAPLVPNSEEFAGLRSRIFMLENQLKEQGKQRYLLAALGVWLVFSTSASFVPECGPYVTYFLVGNGVMGAIIMWHLVRHLRPDNGPKKKGTAREQRR